MSTFPIGVYVDLITSGEDGRPDDTVSDFPALKAAMSTFVGW
jgi:hypothetical protein